MRLPLREAIAAHLMVHTQCKLEPKIAIARAKEIYAFVMAEPGRVSVSPPSGRYAGKRDYLDVALVKNECGHQITFAVRITPDPTGQNPLRLAFGTKAMRTQAWRLARETHAKARVSKLKEEARRARQECGQPAATMKP